MQRDLGWVCGSVVDHQPRGSIPRSANKIKANQQQNTALVLLLQVCAMDWPDAVCILMLILVPQEGLTLISRLSLHFNWSIKG